MTTILRHRNLTQQIYNRELTQALRSYAPQIWEPSVWLTREPDIEEKMLRDADIAHVIGFRQSLIAGKQWALLPKAEGDPASEMAVFVGTEILKAIKKFTEARRNLSRAFFSGSRFARIHAEMRKTKLGDGLERTWWVPFRLEDIDKRQYRIVPDGDEERVAGHWERWNIAKGDWEPETQTDALLTIRHVYNDTQNNLGYGQALRESLGWVWYAKTKVFQEYLTSVERHAGGTLQAKVEGLRDASTGLPNVTLLNEWINKLEDMRARHCIAHDSQDEVTMLPANSEGSNIFDMALGRLQSMAFTVALGANLTTSASEGGSYALAEVQENSTEAIIEYDRESLEETLTDDLVRAVWVKNYANLRELGIYDDMPRFSITQDKQLDPLVRAQVAQALNQIGVDLSAGDLYEQTGFQKPKNGEDLIAGASPQTAMPGFPQFNQP